MFLAERGVIAQNMLKYRKKRSILFLPFLSMYIIAALAQKYRKDAVFK